MQQDIVIFAPHQDDEILGGYAVIRQQPEHIYVVFLTNGDYEGADIARTRWQESCAALTHLGVPRDHILTLGYADTGMPRPVSFLWRLWHGEPGLLLASSVGAHTYHPADGEQEYHLKKWGAHAAYTRETVLADVRAVLEEIRPGAIYMTNEDDVHGDHAAAPLFVQAALAQIPDLQPAVYRYHVHDRDEERWPNRQGDRFDKPENLSAQQWEGRTCIPVQDPDDFRRTMELFVSQWRDAEYLLSFIKKEQVFFPKRED